MSDNSHLTQREIEKVATPWRFGWKAQDRNIRIEKLIFLPLSCCHDAFSDDIWELIDEEGGHLSDIVINGGTWAKNIDVLFDEKDADLEDEDYEPFDNRAEYEKRELMSEIFASHRVRKDYPVYLVQIATPVRTYHKDSNGYGYSWGHYATQWIAGNSASELMRHALKWQAKRIKKWKSEAS